jgi:hypothetical protein
MLIAAEIKSDTPLNHVSKERLPKASELSYIARFLSS